MSVLHITNGDHAAAIIRLVVDGPVVTTADVLHEGPCPPLDGEAWYDLRGRFLAGMTGDSRGISASLAATDRTIVGACGRGDDLVLWFEHDLFDQLQIVRTLDLMVRLGPDTPGDPSRTLAMAGPSRTAPRISLICPGSFPGVDRFIGLGQLRRDQLATLVGTGSAVTAADCVLASRTWSAFRSPDPAALEQIAKGLGPDTTGLVFLRDALFRFFAEFPSVENGLSMTQSHALTVLSGGPATAWDLFRATQAREARPFMGDLTFYDIVRSLAAASTPLVATDGGPAGPDFPAARLAITQAGRDVLAGGADYVALNGINCWRGGVHLTGSNRSPRRWDGRAETLVS